jgi:hypothetical protein
LGFSAAAGSERPLICSCQLGPVDRYQHGRQLYSKSEREMLQGLESAGRAQSMGSAFAKH